MDEHRLVVRRWGVASRAQVKVDPEEVLGGESMSAVEASAIPFIGVGPQGEASAATLGDHAAVAKPR